MSRAYVWFLLSLICLTGCSDDDGDSSAATLDMNGTWSLSASPTSPPRTVACTGTLSSISGDPLCAGFDLEIVQAGSGFTGASSVPFCGADIAVVGSVAGTSVAGQFSEDRGGSVITVGFSGLGSGDSLTVDIDSVSATGGSCTTTGFYLATRQP